MSETYVNRLERIAGSLPPGPCILALVPTVTETHAAGLASDFVQRVARGRDGHTLLFSLEDAPSRLDHELGVEGGAGLVDVIEGRLRLARAATSGRARGFIYVPAGQAPGTGVDLVRSAAWRSLVDSAIGRGGTVVVFMPREVLEAARGAADEPTARIDGIVWLGPEPVDIVWLPWRVLGSIELPDGGASRRPSPAEPASDAEPPEAAGKTRSSDPGRETDPAGRGDPPRQRADEGVPDDAARSPSPGAPPLVRGVSRRARRERERRRRQFLVTTMIVVFLATLAIAAIALVRPGGREAFVPDNFPVWSSPADTAGTAPDTAPVSPDTSGS